MSDEIYGDAEFKRDLAVLEGLVADQLPDKLKTLTWEEMEAGMIEAGGSPGDAAQIVQTIRETGISPSMAVYCLAASDADG